MTRRMLTVVIPFLNEGMNLVRTLDSLRTTQAADVDIIVINDCSADYFNYSDMAKKYDCTYISNNKRQGVARCRDMGVEIAQTPYILLLDAHMKFFTERWDELIVDRLQKNTNTIYSSTSIPLNEEWRIKDDAPEGFGAYILESSESTSLFDFQWSTSPPNESLEIPCIMGAAYAFSKDFYQSIGGLMGLQQWGLDEQFLSIKAFMAGGGCEVIPEFKMGHVYRESMPYENKVELIGYNQIFIPSVLMREDESFSYIENRRNSIRCFEEASKIISENSEFISTLRNYFISNFTRSFQDYFDYNNRFIAEISKAEK